MRSCGLCLVVVLSTGCSERSPERAVPSAQAEPVAAPAAPATPPGASVTKPSGGAAPGVPVGKPVDPFGPLHPGPDEPSLDAPRAAPPETDSELARAIKESRELDHMPCVGMDCDPRDAQKSSVTIKGIKAEEGTTPTAGEVAKRLDRYRSALKQCHMGLLKTDPEAAGRLSIQLKIDEQGRARLERLEKLEAIHDCVKVVVPRWQFPAPRDASGEPTSVFVEILVDFKVE